ncbi:NarK family nitrate/nitrite MFS transporter [Schinkia azotoformans]|uniref:NarK family nitrate/nitrite MFS transporter n=1 Tax=Schinkia azotoformans TaxID=1454 RepID=UPI002DB5A177|nr:NarK family nitrate/nitrite MFS transporter [Schinkia azotoformans]MEC1720512.1 NarK family nitrate/nitrite MFS transporter [Schinkia azotoformans]MED4414048.1 NarK family nitrate/nitrite MFS transporter [Schinkia azotoformans]
MEGAKNLNPIKSDRYESKRKGRIPRWNPEDEKFWNSEGKRHANRNLWISVAALFLAFVVWQIWSVVAVNLNDVGFSFTSSQLFTLAALPGLVGATLRIFFTFMPGIVGGKNWTVISTALLLLPAVGIGIAVQNPETSFTTMAILAALCGIGGGNFSSSMANIAYFFPKKLKGSANGINAGLGNLGVSAVQFVTPLVIATGTFAGLFGSSQVSGSGSEVWIQNAAYIWVIPIALVTIIALWGMDNLPNTKQSVKEQAIIFKNKHTWIMSWLYTMCFGSFIGYAAAFPLLIKSEFPEVNALQLAFLGPLVGASVRPIGGWISDKLGGAIVTFWDIIIMIAATTGVIYFLNQHHFTGFLVMFIILFFTTGIANGSTFRMIPIIFEPKQASPVLGFTGAIAAYGAFIIPKIFSWSISTTGTANLALYLFIAYYGISLVVCWYYYTRKNAEVKC